jgi:hypothetical protein
VASAACKWRLEVVRSTPKMAALIDVRPFHMRQSARQIFGFDLVAILCPRAELTPVVSRGLLLPSKAQQVRQVDKRNHAALDRHQAGEESDARAIRHARYRLYLVGLE